MDERDVNERLARMEERLRRLEALLGTTSSPPPPTPAAAPAHDTAEKRPPLTPLTPPPLPTVRRPRRVEPVEPFEPLPAAPPPVVRPVAPPAPTARVGASNLETQVGLKWAGWAGAVIVVIGAALGIKYAYDQEWFGAIPPAARLALMSLGGFALLAAGEVVYRRVGALASAGVFGAGVATLFVVSYAGYGVFDLYAREPAFVMMGLVTLVGAAVAIRGNLVSIAVLSIIGGNVAPIWLRSDVPQLVPLMAYLLALQGVALILAWWGRDPKWWTLRAVAFVTICLWMVLPVVAIDDFGAGVSRMTVLAFVLIYAALFHFELILSSLRDPRPLTTREPSFTVPVPLGQHDGIAEQRGLGVTFSLFVTAALTVAMLLLLRDLSPLWRGAWTIGLAAACLLLGLSLPRLIPRRDPLAPPSAALGLAISYRIQAAALVVVAVPVALSGVWVTTAWAVLAIALALAGAAYNLAVSRVAAVLVWMLATAHLALWTLGSMVVGGTGGGAGPMAVWTVILGEPIPAYLILAALIAAAGHAIAAIVREDWSPGARVRGADVSSQVSVQVQDAGETPAPLGGEALPAIDLNYESRDTVAPRPRAAAVFQSLATLTDGLAVLAFVAAAWSTLPPPGATLAWLCYGWALIGVAQVLRASDLAPAGIVLIAVAAAKWLAYDTLVYSDVFGLYGGAAVSYRPLYNPVAAVGAALFASALAVLRLPLREEPPMPQRIRWQARVRATRGVGGFVAVLVALWLLTTEIVRHYDGRAAVAGSGAWTAQDFALAKHVALSIAWSVYAVVCVTLGFAIRKAGLRYFGLALFALTVGKVMLVDLGTVRTGYRVLSFLGLGLLLLGTSVLYGKLSPLLLRHEPERR